MSKKFIFLFLILSVFIFTSCSVENGFFNSNKYNSSCVVKEEIVVSGDSMSPLIKDGEVLIHLKGYYACNEIKRNDLVTYKYGGNDRPILKKVRAIYNDTFEYKDNKIIVNKEVLKNSEKIEYTINSKMLTLYANSYPRLPENSALILGDNPQGSVDSSKFGLVGKADLVGKVELKKR